MGEVIRKKPASSESWKDSDLRPSLYSWIPGDPSPAGHVGGELGHAFGGLGELTVKLFALVQIIGPGKPELGRLAVLEGFARPGVGVEVVHLPGGDAEFVAAASDEKFAGLGFRSGLDGARGVIAVERGHALRFFFVADVVVPQHSGRSFHRAPSGAAGISALDAIRAAPEPFLRTHMFPEREASLAPSAPCNANRKSGRAAARWAAAP